MERGQVTPLVAVVVLLVGVSAVWLGRMGEAAVLRARVRTAADAAALAGAAEGRVPAAQVAEANGGRLVRYDQAGTDTQVEVRLGRAQASARARRAGGDAPFGLGTLATGQGEGGLAPAMRAAMARAEQLLGRHIPITSGFRSTAEQAALYDRRARNPYPVARPGTSMHERGLAIDVPRSFVPTLLSVASAVGLCHPYPVTDPVHFEVCGHG